MASPLRILHCHSTFAAGGKERRAVRLMNDFGGAASHVVLSAMPGRLAARDEIDRAIAVDFPADAPPLAGRPSPARYAGLARYMARFDLVLTYNWGAMDAVMARRIHGGRGLPPLVHHEDGFNEDEIAGQKARRIWFRRIALGAAHALVVPSRRLEEIARESWKQPPERVRRIANGIAVEKFARSPEPGAIPGLERAPDDVVIGTLAGLRRVKNLPRLVRAYARAPAYARLVIVGEGPEEEAIRAEAARCGVADRVLLAGFLADPARFIGHFDIFALSSDSEQFPISLVEAMAAGLPVAATRVGDVEAMVSEANRALIRDPADEDGLANALATLVGDEALRRGLGIENQREARGNFGEAKMLSAYRRLYAEAVDRPDWLG